jgi:ribosomal protein S18 acetylase RimI-like enzyme
MQIARLQPQQRDELAKLIHASLDVWYRTKLGMDRFGTAWEPYRLNADIYEALDPGCCVVATDGQGTMIGAAFYHPRETHVGVGVVSVHPSVFGRGVARAMMEEIVRAANGLPLRLVSSSMNLDSFSLYTRLGFVPQMMLQAVTLTVPSDGLSGAPTNLRPATLADVPAIADLEFKLNGVRKEKDYRFFVENKSGDWRLLVLEKPGGGLAGFLAAIAHPANFQLGTGVAHDEATMQCLVHGMLDQYFRGQNIVWLLPSACPGLVRQAYDWGARNRELHILSVLGKAPPMHGVTIPTFMPESG